MTHPRGSLTYNPTGQFNLPRSYVDNMRFYVQSVSVATLVGREVHISYSPVPTFLGVVAFRPEFWTWTSNVYSLDFLVEANYYSYDGGLTESVLPVYVGWDYDALLRRPTLNFVLDLGVVIYRFDLPPRPTGYWLGPAP